MMAMKTSPASSASNDFTERVRENLEEIQSRIVATGRDPNEIRIVAVTKSFGEEAVHAARASGIHHVGENYVDELELKRKALDSEPLTWHYLGALQTNKINRIVEFADLVCGVARVKEIEKIARSARAVPIYLQVDFTSSPQRNGATPDELPELVARARDCGLEVRGLMTVAPADPDGARTAFELTRRLTDELALAECSMGMTDDLEIACNWGTTELRVGRGLFGPRQTLTPST